MIFTRLIRLALVAILLTGCASTAQQRRSGAAVTIVSAGGLVRLVHEAKMAVYREAADALMARGVIGLEFDRAIRPMDIEDQARDQAIAALASALYAAAQITDRSRTAFDEGAYRDAASLIIRELDRALEVLQRGAILPAVPIPQEVHAVLQALHAVVGGTP